MWGKFVFSLYVEKKRKKALKQFHPLHLVLSFLPFEIQFILRVLIRSLHVRGLLRAHH